MSFWIRHGSAPLLIGMTPHAALQGSHGAYDLHTLSLETQAAQKPKGSIERLLLVAAFAQSAFQAVGKLKCMYPISGETYEVGPLRCEVPLPMPCMCNWKQNLAQVAYPVSGQIHLQ